MKATTISSRLYQTLLCLLPEFPNAVDGTTLQADNIASGDFTMFVAIERQDDHSMRIELSHGHSDQTPTSTSYSIAVNLDSKEAVVVALHDGWRYEVVRSESGELNPRAVNMQIQAINWLAVVANLKYSITVDTPTHKQNAEVA